MNASSVVEDAGNSAYIERMSSSPTTTNKRREIVCDDSDEEDDFYDEGESIAAFIQVKSNINRDQEGHRHTINRQDPQEESKIHKERREQQQVLVVSEIDDDDEAD